MYLMQRLFIGLTDTFAFSLCPPANVSPNVPHHFDEKNKIDLRQVLRLRFYHGYPLLRTM